MIKRLLFFLGVLIGVFFMQIFVSPDTLEMIQKNIDNAVNKASIKYGVEEILIKAVINNEGGKYPYAIRFEKKLMIKNEDNQWYWNILQNETNITKEMFCSLGPMQILYGVGKSLNFNIKKPSDLFEIDLNVDTGTLKLKQCLDKYPYNIKDAIASYNRGWPERNDNGQYVNQVYVDNVYNYYKKFGGRK